MNHAFLKDNAVLFSLASPGIAIADALRTERVSVNPTAGIEAGGASESLATYASGCVVLAGQTRT